METLWRCARCSLLFGHEGIPETCPACLRRSSIPPTILVAGRDMREFVVREYGRREGLLDPQVRKGLDKLKAGICPHGWITSAICTSCN